MSKYINQYSNYAAYSGDSSNFNYPHAAYLNEEKVGMYDRNPSRFYDVYGTVVDGTTGITITLNQGGYNAGSKRQVTVNGNEFFYNKDIQVDITGFASVFLNQPVTSIIKFGLDTTSATTMQYMFKGCSALTHINLSNINTAAVTNLGDMFKGCSALISIDVSNFNTSNVTNMSNIFSGCKSLTSIDVTNFDTRKATAMSGMFNGCSALTSIDVSNFNTSGVTQMASMFEGCSGLTSLDLSNFNTSGVTYSKQMFRDCTNLTTLNISNWDMSNMPNNSDGIQSMFINMRGITSIIMNNTNQTTLEKVQANIPSIAFIDMSKVTITRDGYNWTYSGGQWSSTPIS